MNIFSRLSAVAVLIVFLPSASFARTEIGQDAAALNVETADQVLELEVPDATHTKIQVREHPRTGKPYIVITDENAASPRYKFQTDIKQYSIPDYRMLDPKVKPKDVGYVGPKSDRKKVYALAATLAVSGVAGGLLLPVAPATGAGAAGGAGLYGAAGAGVAAGTISTAWNKTQPRPDDDFAQHSEAKLLERASNDKESEQGV